MQDNNLPPWDHDQHGWHGHPDEKGHAFYADYLADYVDKYLSSL